jgi:hypothetical protein
MDRKTKRMLLVVVLCAALAAAVVGVALTAGGHGTEHAAGPGPRHIPARPLTIYAEPQLFPCFSIAHSSDKPLPKTFPTRGLAGCKWVSSSMKAG